MEHLDKNGKTLVVGDVVRVPKHPEPMKVERLLNSSLVHIVDNDVDHEDYQIILKSDGIEKIS